MVSTGKPAPRVTVLLPVYNGGSYLVGAIESILNQTYADFELLAIDDGSTDETARILQAAAAGEPRIHLIRQERMGLPRTLNRGLAMARGEFIARQDADDLSLPSRLAVEVAFLDTHPEVAMVGCSFSSLDESGNLLFTVDLPTQHGEIEAALSSEMCFVHGSVMFRRAALAAVGGYRPEFPIGEDYDLFLRLSECCTLANLPEPLYQYRHSSAGMSQRKGKLLAYYMEIARELARQRREDGTDVLFSRI